MQTFEEWITREKAIARGEDVSAGGDEDLLGVYRCQCGFGTTVEYEAIEHVKVMHDRLNLVQNDWAGFLNLAERLIYPNPVRAIYPELAPQI